MLDSKAVEKLKGWAADKRLWKDGVHLGPGQRAEVVLRFVRGTPIAEIASDMEVSETTVSGWLERCRSKGPSSLFDDPNRRRGGRSSLTVAQVARAFESRGSTNPGTGRPWTTYEIAAELGVSQSTISRLLRRKKHQQRP